MQLQVAARCLADPDTKGLGGEGRRQQELPLRQNLAQADMQESLKRRKANYVETRKKIFEPSTHQRRSTTPAKSPTKTAHSNSCTVVAQVHAAPLIDYDKYYSHSYTDQGELKHALRH